MGVNVHVVTLWENFSRNYVRTSLSWVYTFATEESINVPDNDNLPDNLYVKVYLYMYQFITVEFRIEKSLKY